MMDGIVMDGCLAIRFDVFQKSMLHAGSNQTYVGSCFVGIGPLLSFAPWYCK